MSARRLTRAERMEVLEKALGEACDLLMHLHVLLQQGMDFRSDIMGVRGIRDTLEGACEEIEREIAEEWGQ